MTDSQDRTSAAGTQAADLSGRRLVVFDFDGTLSDTRPYIIKTAIKVLRDHGIPEDQLDPANVGRIVGPAFPGAFAEVFGVSMEEAEAITADYRAIYNYLGLKAWPFFPGVRDLLSALKSQGRLLAVASAKRHGMVVQSLEDNQAQDLFDYVSGWGGGIGGKDQIILDALATLGVKKDDCLMVGDRHHDAEAAAKADVGFVGVTYGGTSDPGEFDQAGALCVVPSVEGLARVLLGPTFVG